MKNQHESLETDAKPKMLFNSDGFNFLVKFVTVLFTVIGAVLLVVLKIIGAFFETSSNKKMNDDNDEIAYYDDDGHAYTKNGDIKW